MNRKIIITLSILLLLSGGYIFYENNMSSVKLDETGESPFGPMLGDVEEIIITSGDHGAHLKEEDGRWMAVSPVDKTVDGDQIDDLISLFNLGIIAVLDTNPSKYGLDRPEVEFSVKIKGEPDFQTLLIGLNNPTKTACYAKVKGRQRVMLIGILQKRKTISLLEDVRI